MNLRTQIVDYCSPRERTFADLWDHFDGEIGALWEAIDAGQITRRTADDGCIYYRASFPGIDIDRVHHARDAA